jgi:MoaA/NifB/PqqE/SkfB family radical SAM enzyme
MFGKIFLESKRESNGFFSKNGYLSILKGYPKFIRNTILGKPRIIYLEVTKRCNAQCDFCDYWKSGKQEELKDYKSIVEHFNPFAVVLTGGEPLLRPDIANIIRETKSSSTEFVSLITNGSLLTPEKAYEFYENGLDGISISLNYPNAAHDEQRKIPGLYKHIVDILPEIRKIGFKRLGINTVIMDTNLDQVIDLAKKSKEWGIGITFSCYSPEKNGNKRHIIEENHLMYLKEIVDSILQMKQNGSHILNSTWYLKKIIDFNTNGFVPNCQAGKLTVHITPDGYVKPCPDLPVVSHFSDYNGKHCKCVSCETCWYACRGEVESPMTLGRILELVRFQKGDNGSATP